MRHLQLIYFALQIALLNAQKTGKNNINVYKTGKGAVIHGNRIDYPDPDSNDEDTEHWKAVICRDNKVPVLNSKKDYFACCLKDQKLLGSPDTAWDCCAEGHELVGHEKKYRCCPTASSFDGNKCVTKEETCKNGKVMKDGKCVCPEGSTDDGKDGCKQTNCSSGLVSGKCYYFTAETGRRLGIDRDNTYYAKPESIDHRNGKFQLCVDQDCAPGKPVDPSSKFYIKDLYGDVGTGANKGQWLDNSKNGAHIKRTASFDQAGQFSISKWPCGKYCIGGFSMGIGPACPAEYPAMTFYEQDPQMCVLFDLTEVPCDVKSNNNNCFWTSGDQCCNKVDCAGKQGGAPLR